MRTYKTFAIINVENDSLVILGRCSKEQLERMCEEMNATQNLVKSHRTTESQVKALALVLRGALASVPARFSIISQLSSFVNRQFE